MSGKKVSERGKFRFTLGEMLVGIMLFAIPLAYWTSNVRGFKYSPLSPSSQKLLAAYPQQSLAIQKKNDSRNLHRLRAYQITFYVVALLSSATFATFLMIRRLRRRRISVTFP